MSCCYMHAKCIHAHFQIMSDNLERFHKRAMRIIYPHAAWLRRDVS